MMAINDPGKRLLDTARKIEKAFEQQTSAVNMKEYGEDAKDALILRVQRLSKGVSDGKTEKLKGLEESTINTRKRYKSRLGSGASPNKSNATFTGQLVESLNTIGARGKFIIFPKNTARKTITGKTSSVTNKEVLDYYQEDRPFLELSKAENNKIARLFREEFRKLIKNLTNIS